MAPPAPCAAPSAAGRSTSPPASRRWCCATSPTATTSSTTAAGLATARELLFAEPGYDCPALGPDPLRRRVVDATPADGWSATRAPAPGAPAGRVRHEPLRWWALIELADGRRRMEGVARDADWLDEPGGATLPATARDFLGYAGPAGELIRAA